jgi:hypothetical protein
MCHTAEDFKLLESMVQGLGWSGREYCPLLGEIPYEEL